MVLMGCVLWGKMDGFDTSASIGWAIDSCPLLQKDGVYTLTEQNAFVCGISFEGFHAAQKNDKTEISHKGSICSQEDCTLEKVPDAE
jgi:hypothetical protein